MKTLALRSLERLRAADPSALRDLADAQVSRTYAAAILRDAAAAAAEFGTDAAAVARLVAILRHDFGRAPIGSSPPSA